LHIVIIIIIIITVITHIVKTTEKPAVSLAVESY